MRVFKFFSVTIIIDLDEKLSESLPIVQYAIYLVIFLIVVAVIIYILLEYQLLPTFILCWIDLSLIGPEEKGIPKSLSFSA